METGSRGANGVGDWGTTVIVSTMKNYKNKFCVFHTDNCKPTFVALCIQEYRGKIRRNMQEVLTIFVQNRINRITRDFYFFMLYIFSFFLSIFSVLTIICVQINLKV